MHVKKKKNNILNNFKNLILFFFPNERIDNDNLHDKNQNTILLHNNETTICRSNYKFSEIKMRRES